MWRSRHIAAKAPTTRSPDLALVVMTGAGGVTVAAGDLLRMIVVGQGLMTAGVAVHLGVVLMGKMR